MPETAQERTEAPTPRRREEARSRGQVGRSTDLTAAVALLGTLVFLQVTGRDLFGRLLEVMRRCLGETGQDAATAGGMKVILEAAAGHCAAVLLPLLLTVLVVAGVTAFLQVGVLLTTRPLRPSLDKLNPLSGLQRMFSARSFVHLLMGVLKAGLLGLVAWYTLHGRMDVLASACRLPHTAMIGMAAEVVLGLALRLAVVLLLLAIIDFVYQKYRTERDLRMTKEEIREELKRMDGDPKLKARRRRVQMQLSLQRIQSTVPRADVVVTNPTELAVALQYDGATMRAPRVIAKGADYVALRIRQVAVANGVPIVERKPLARALYRDVAVGQEIPAELYKAVAEVLAYVYELTGRSRRRPAAEPVMN